MHVATYQFRIDRQKRLANIACKSEILIPAAARGRTIQPVIEDAANAARLIATFYMLISGFIVGKMQDQNEPTPSLAGWA